LAPDFRVLRISDFSPFRKDFGIYIVKSSFMKEQRKGLLPANKVRQDSTVKIRTFEKSTDMERIVNLHIQKLSGGLYLATSDSIQGLVAQGRTISETIEIARDVARKLIEAQEDCSILRLGLV
jgi:predicted RNase H-like HicB family nuclease